ncbi:MAG: hypothetical protein A2469_01785 [Candidatus Magasanikbacteria bacterium RIFOXYC2_FULL_40_16]|uniref:WG repeat-containing protein n=3 Tax=Candidatus Magasanikiibacteriota TaxID=1752731 RepID=A0A1F6NGU9_9BACT|nr:MAG: hypothetical protein A2224_01460 [Candidatus Magasanikbacteria bacterium RIFOXYA2_FULL_40_20]OGH83091.1 MAG: hypothetical protein A2373_02475 [Candidatus Magasanikbacteria bacterium RIFOXYB1_FULL_40_15]OGH85677.1 MAG: hypothetical protein A2301_00165 [Candidatus Magasanikbacteria bacterium RIFOXYB2_FULL_40_13]OGH87902.1 MAG: hypothetical protein A2206_03575 [Candidatus Magasanikbacteria bacterium RIFOXYA1_FULL_40_8]OGH90361.1 MAG: hypothetical protein A2469_01785 [Candidatus Magasanikba
MEREKNTPEGIGDVETSKITDEGMETVVIDTNEQGLRDRLMKECGLDFIGVFSENEGLAVAKKDGKYFYIKRNTTSEDIDFLQKYEKAEDYSNGRAWVKDGRGFYQVDQRGVYVDYNERYRSMGKFFEDLAWVQPVGGDGKYFIDRTGRRIIANYYDDVGDFSEGLARVEIDGKWFFINKTGQAIDSKVYDQVDDFHNGFAEVVKGEETFFIDKTGKRLEYK